jgi:FkbM family methyltransferase
LRPLSFGQRLKLLRQRAFALLRVGGDVDVRIEATADGAIVRVEGRTVAVPSPWRWKLYRKGWAARLDRLEREYGVGRHFTLRPGDVVLDVGANVGEFAHVCARYGAAAYCLEPDPSAFVCLRRNIADLPQAMAFDFAAWNEDGEIDFFLAPDRADSSAFAAGPGVRRPAMRIESFLREAGVTRVDLLKCDAEGAEPEVLEGVGGAFAMVRGVALDTGPERAGARTDAACAGLLRRNGFIVVHETVGARLMTYGLRPDAGRGGA